MTDVRYKEPHLATSVQDLMSIYGKVPTMNIFSSIEKHIITTKTLLQQARIYRMEGDLEQLYVLLFRFASYVVQEFPKHPSYSKTHPKIVELRKEAAKIIGDLEQLKQNLIKLYQQQEEVKRNPPKKEEQVLPPIPPPSQNSFTSFSNINNLSQQLEKMSMEEREASFMKASPKPSSPTTSLAPDNTPLAPSIPLNTSNSTLQNSNTTNPTASGFSPLNPCFLVQDPLTGMFIPVNAIPAPEDQPTSTTPTLDNSTSISKPTAIDAKLDALLNPKAEIPTTTPTSNPTTTSSTPKPTSTTVTTTTGKAKRRTVIVEGELFSRFMEISAPNTNKNIETCGILAGYLKDDVMRITHCIIPKQTGSSDTCAMTHEEEILDYCDKKDLITLGWIHTHPQHQLFLSSVDMHTHCSYQSLLDEAIAVVVAPKYVPNFGIFSLTDVGLDVIQNCPARGFHPHEKFGLYNTCSHVKLVWGKNTFVVDDLRKKK